MLAIFRYYISHRELSDFMQVIFDLTTKYFNCVNT